MNETDISKYLSYLLRHAPESAGLTLDTEGWAAIDAVLAGAARGRKPFDRAALQQAVDNNSKKRFEVSADGLRIRAVQGHSSTQVARNYAPVEPPATLFHGTATRFLESIRAKGLIPGNRHHVHLSGDAQTAVAVGQRHGKPVVLVVDAQAMRADGHTFHQAENGVWLTAAVPPSYLSEA
jgi:putative RNA 2'-phosphotransferase